MNKVYGTLLGIIFVAFCAYELVYNYKEYESFNEYEYEESLLVEEDTAVMWFDKVMDGAKDRQGEKDSIIDNLLERVRQHGISRRDFDMAEKLMEQRESLAYQRGLHHDTLIIDTVIYHELHRDTIVYDTQYIHVVDTIHKDTVIYEQTTGWKSKKRKKKGNGWKRSK
jgi:hypothetical protein